jgi:diaminopimelate epimerase
MAGAAAVIFYLNPHRDKPLELQTRAGKKTVALLSRSGMTFRQRVEIGEPDFSNTSFFPFLKEDQFCYLHLNYSFYPVSVGNPHIVLLPEDNPPESELMSAARELSSAGLFPLGTNVEFVRQDPSRGFEVFFFERGVGKTLCSSTGSAAVYAVLKTISRVEGKLALRCPSGTILIQGFPRIRIENKTDIVYKGIYER